MAGTSPDLPAVWSEPDPRCCLSTSHELLPIPPHSSQSHKHLQENIHSISGSWQRDRLFKTYYCCNIKNPPKIDIVAWPYRSVWPQPASTMGEQKWGQASALNSLTQEKGAHKEPTACRLQLSNFAVAWYHLPMNTGIWTPPVPLLTEDPGSAPLSIVRNHINPPSSMILKCWMLFYSQKNSKKFFLIFKQNGLFPQSAWCNL